MHLQQSAKETIQASVKAPVPASQLAEGVDLRGKRALVTGATGGIGITTARALALAGAEVVIGGRPGAKLDKARESLASQFPEAISAVALDLLSVQSVEAAAQQIRAGAKLDILIHNAGIIGPLAYSDEGVESGFMVNAAAPALLTSLLSSHLEQNARLAFVSSFGHHYSPVVFDDVNFRSRDYSPWASYGQSKSAMCLLAIHLSRGFNARGIDVFSLHPGAIQTDLTRTLTEEDIAVPFERGSQLTEADFITVDEGAATSFWAVTAPELAGYGGLYLENCAVAEVVDEPNYFSGVMPHAIDPALAQAIWPLVEQVLGRSLPLIK